MDMDLMKSPLKVIYGKTLLRFSLLITFMAFVAYHFIDNLNPSAINELNLKSSSNLHQWFLIANIILITAGILISASYSSIKKSDIVIFDTTLNCLLAAFSFIFIELIHIYGVISSNAHYIASICVHAFYLYTVSSFVAELLKLPRKWIIGIGLVHTSALLLIHFIDLQDLRLGGRFEQNLVLALQLHALVFLAPIATLIGSSFSPELRLDEQSFFESAKRRISHHNLANHERALFFSILVIELVSVCILAGQYNLSYGNNASKITTNFHQPFFHGHFSWIPLLVISITLFKKSIQRRLQSAKLSALVKPQIKRLFERQDFNNTDIATSVGMRTASFMINFDAGGILKKQLPAFSLRFRGHEVLNTVRNIFEEKLLGEQLNESSIVGAIDPEQSSTPCVDLLKGLAVLHLDGISLVEKRIKNLVKLFPILDQDLAKIISSENVNESLNKAKWHYTLRFDWIEQAITNNALRTEYLLQIENSETKKNDVTTISLDRNQKLHSLIILDKTALNRLSFEAPHLISIIETFKPKMSAESEHVEEEIFYVRLEKLIPRLHKFYNIEKIRKNLASFPIETKSEKDFEFIDSQIKKAANHKDMQNILVFFEGKTWSGYQEKDQALDLLIAAFERLRVIDLSENHRSKNTKRILSLIESIGFPCQALYYAHQKKLLIRETNTLANICLNPKHPRFHEAWILASTLNMEKYSNEQILSLLLVIDDITSKPASSQDGIIKFKISEAFFNIASYLKVSSHDQLSATFNQLIKFACKENFPIEVLNFLLDGYIHLRKDKGISIEFSEAGLMHLENFVEIMENNQIKDSFEANSIISRWKLIKQERSESLSPVDILVS